MRSTAARRKANTVVRPGGNGYCHPAMNSDMHTDAGWLHRFGPVDQLVLGRLAMSSKATWAGSKRWRRMA
jgi:hypothetical protein